MNLALSREIVTRQEAAYVLNLEDTDFQTWMSDDAAAAFAKGDSNIPQMPHIPGRPVKFHLDTLRQWRLRYFQKGGEPQEHAEPRRRR